MFCRQKRRYAERAAKLAKAKELVAQATNLQELEKALPGLVVIQKSI